MQLIQVVPRMGPWDGVGDYAAQLGESLRARHGVPSTFVEGGGEPGRQAVAAAIAGANAGDAVLLHYVGYGYAKRGAPLWLPRSVVRADVRLGVVFHELYATGRPWQSSFWLSGLQQLVTRRLARECSFALVTRQASRAWLERNGAVAGKHVGVLPIPSTVGEPPDVSAAGDRPAVMAVWGSAQAKERVYRHYGTLLAALVRELGLEKIVDIGPPTGLAPPGIAVEERGRLPAAELSRVLLGARCGLLAYPASFLAKSTIFAAYAAHGTVSLIIDDAGTLPGDGLMSGRHFLCLSRNGLDGRPSLDEVARNARAWYAGHSTAVHADALRRMLEGDREP